MCLKQGAVKCSSVGLNVEERGDAQERLNFFKIQIHSFPLLLTPPVAIRQALPPGRSFFSYTLSDVSSASLRFECWRQDWGDGRCPAVTRGPRRPPLWTVAGRTSVQRPRVSAPIVRRGPSFWGAAQEPALEPPGMDRAPAPCLDHPGSRGITRDLILGHPGERGATGAWPISSALLGARIPVPLSCVGLTSRTAPFRRLRSLHMSPAPQASPGAAAASPSAQRTPRQACLRPPCHNVGRTCGLVPRSVDARGAGVLHRPFLSRSCIGAPCRCTASSAPKSLLGSAILFTRTPFGAARKNVREKGKDLLHKDKPRSALERGRGRRYLYPPCSGRSHDGRHAVM